MHAPRSPKIILDISQTQGQSVYTKPINVEQDPRQFEESVKVEPCDYCGRLKSSCLCCRNFVKVMTDPYYERSPNASECLPPLNNHYSSPQPNVIREGSLMISPDSNNSFISIEELNRKRRLSGDYDYEENPGMYVSPPSDCVYESNAKRGRYEPEPNDPTTGAVDGEMYRKFYSTTQYNGHFYQTDPPLMLKPFSGSTETVISIGGPSPEMDCQMMSHHQQQEQSPLKNGLMNHQQPPPVESELPPIFTLCANESAQSRVNLLKYLPSPEPVYLDMEDEYEDIKSVDSRLTSEGENANAQHQQKRGRPKSGAGNKGKKKQQEKEASSFEDLQQMRVMANVRERQRTQVNRKLKRI